MDDDLDTPGALAALHELVSEGNHALEADPAGSARVHPSSATGPYPPKDCITPVYEMTDQNP